jgi:hypothetical protein
MLLVTFILLAAVSCKKDFSGQQEQSQKSVDPAKVFKTPSTPEEKLLVENLGKVTEIFKELYKDKSNIKVVNAAIFSKAFTDESVLLKDLIFPKNSWLNKVVKFKTYTQKWNVSLNKFADNFWTEVNKKNDPGFIHFLTELNAATSNAANRTETYEGDQVTVYFPYSEEFVPIEGGVYEPITSIVTATADADEGWGNLPYYVNDVLQYYIQVIVNDDYCFDNPTHIVGVNGIETVLEPAEPTDAPPPPPPPPGISRVYIGEGLCKEQYDRLISLSGNGGGSEIKYCHLTGYLQPVNGHVTTFQDIVSVDFSRKNIRQKKWLRNFTVWDDDWVAADLEQILGIYEEDNTNTKTFNGSLGTTLGLDSLGNSGGATVTGSIGFSVTIQSQDDIIRQLKISRNSYFGGAFQDQAWGFSSDATFLPLPFTHGWPYYDTNGSGGANVGWTWPYNTY